MHPSYLFHVYSVSEVCNLFNISIRKAQALKKKLHKPYKPLNKLPRVSFIRDNLKFNLMHSTPKFLSPGYSVDFIAYSLSVSKSLLPWYGNPHYQQYMRSRKWVLMHKIKAKPENILYLENLGIHVYDQNIITYKSLKPISTAQIPLTIIQELLESKDIKTSILTHSQLIRESLKPVTSLPEFIPSSRRLYTCDDTYDSILEYIQ